MKQLKLNGGNGDYNKGVEFELNCSFSYIKIKTIILDSLCGKYHIVEWVSKLQQANIYLEVEYDGDNMGSKKITHYFLTDVTGQHQIPVFNYNNWCFPKENVKNISGNGYKKLKLRLYSTLYSFDATIIYEESPGVIIIVK